jgi:glutathione S-transferase
VFEFGTKPVDFDQLKAHPDPRTGSANTPMILIGRYDSPYVRRVGVSLHVLAISLELLPLSPFSQAPQLRQFSSIGRMPALILANGEVLIDSAAILDYLDDIVGSSRALLPVAGEPRRRCLRILASATAACDKAIAISYERRRPSEMIIFDWIARCRTQLDAALAELDSFKRLSWPIHDRVMQNDITTACMLGYVRRVEPDALPDGRYPYLEELAALCEEHSAFRACPEAA